MSGLLAQVLVCTGTSCLPSSGGPPVDSLKAQWKQRRLYGRIHLTFTGCLGRCDRPAQMLICHPSGTLSFAAIDGQDAWDALASWASASTAAGRLLHLPYELQRHLDHPWQKKNYDGPFRHVFRQPDLFHPQPLMHPQLLSPEATADWPSAISIRGRVRNLVILPRQPPTWISEALDALPEMALPEIEMSGNVESIGRRAALHIASELPGDLGSWLAADVRMLLGGWALVARETRCLLRLEAVGTDACSKFHTDMVRIRLLCTYRGPGSEWVPDEQVRRSRLGPLGENEDIVPNSAEIRRVPRFAVALLKGDAYDPHTRRRTPQPVPRRRSATSPPPTHRWETMIRPNPTGDLPVIAASAFVDPTAIICGKVVIGESVFVGPYAVVRADEVDADGQLEPITIGDGSNIQDGVVIHSKAGAAVTIGAGTSIAHRAIVHGPCHVGDRVFIGFNAVVFNCTIGAGSVIRHNSVVENCHLPEGFHVPATTTVHRDEDLASIPRVDADAATFSESVAVTNRWLVLGYKRIMNEA